MGTTWKEDYLTLTRTIWKEDWTISRLPQPINIRLPNTQKTAQRPVYGWYEKGVSESIRATIVSLIRNKAPNPGNVPSKNWWSPILDTSQYIHWSMRSYDSPRFLIASNGFYKVVFACEDFVGARRLEKTLLTHTNQFAYPLISSLSVLLESCCRLNRKSRGSLLGLNRTTFGLMSHDQLVSRTFFDG